MSTTAAGGMGLMNTLINEGESLTNQPVKTNLIPMPATKPGELSLILKSALLNPLDEVKAPPSCLQICENGYLRIVQTLGNFSLGIGKAKSRKTFLVSLFFAVIAGYINSKIIGCLPENKNVGIYFDTEQSKYHVQMLLQRICKLLGIAVPGNVLVYHLRKYTPLERLQLIEYAIYNTPNLGYVVIDGIRDLVTSINDEDQATAITTKLMKWTEEKDIHIMAVLHQNKGDNNARGHLGAELVNKAETVLSIAKDDKDNTVSTVEPEQCRDMDFSPFSFTIDFDGLPQILDGYTPNKAISPDTKKDIIAELGDREIYKLLSSSFSKNKNQLYSELVRSVKNLIRLDHNKTIGDNKVKDILTYSKSKNWIEQAADKQPYTLGQYEPF